MPASGWYDDNENRDFPFLQEEPSQFPRAVIVDAGFIFGDYAGFDPADHEVTLASVKRAADHFEFTFTTDATGMADQQIVFSVLSTAGRYTITYADSEAVAGAGEPDVCDGTLIGSGYLVTGDLTLLLSTMAVDDVLEPDSILEPTLVRALASRAVTALHIANSDRTRFTSPPGCKSMCWDFTVAPIYVRETCLQGAIGFKEGFNSAIQVNAFDNSITFNAVEAGGEGRACDDVELFPDETPPAGRDTLDGGLKCDQVLRSINNVGGENIPIIAGPGVSALPDNAHNKLIIDVSGRDLAACLDVESTPATATPDSPGGDPCDCGPTP